jgi:hypothetical protein
LNIPAHARRQAAVGAGEAAQVQASPSENLDIPTFLRRKLG